MSSNSISDEVAELLTSGGDERLILGPESGVNRYGCKPRPYEHISLSSCTASTISTGAFRSICGFYEDELKPGRADLSSLFQHVRDELRAVVGLDDTVDIALAPSGTDLELLALALFDMGSRILNISVGPDEVGSGALEASHGQYFSDRLRNGLPARRGATIPGFDHYDIDVTHVDIRDDDGTPRPDKRIVEEIEATIRAGERAGRQVILHCIFKSKTGLVTPSKSAVEKLVANHPTVLFIVDACQYRNTNASIREFLDLGCVVLVTGSKFFGAPPFCGAAFVPESLRDRFVENRDIPRGLNHFFGREELPHRWNAFNPFLEQQRNEGLLLRWRAAIYEMRQFASIDPAKFLRSSYLFQEVAQKTSDDYEHIKLETQPIYDDLDIAERAFSQTLLTFSITGLQIDYSGARQLYESLFNPDGNKPIHIGQPVKVRKQGSEWVASLRVALGSSFFSAQSGSVRKVQEAFLSERLHHVFRAVEQRALSWQAVSN